MPNHVTNIISKEVADLMKSEEGLIDFNSVIPMPRSLIDPDPQQMNYRAKMALGMIQDNYERIIASKCIDRPIDPKEFPLLIAAIKNIKDYGHAYWYPWATDNWGTKWNAYDASIKGEKVHFDTAWAHPNNVFLELSKQNPDLLIECKYADEDVGNNAMEIHYKSGEVIFSRDLSFVECWDIICPDDDMFKAGYDEHGNYDENKDKRCFDA